MEYKSFHIKNFKGISDQTINLGKRPAGRVFTLVGLNESEKTIASFRRLMDALTDRLRKI